jgi:hypothetical protein
MINLQYIVKAEKSHIEDVIENIRKPDEIEIKSLGLSVRSALEISFNDSTECYAIVKDGVTYGVFGIVQAGIDGVAVPWAFMTAGVEKHVVHFNRSTKKVIKAWRDKYGYMKNHVKTDNKRTILWLKFHGFKFYPAVPFGVFGREFYPFDMGEL